MSDLRAALAAAGIVRLDPDKKGRQRFWVVGTVRPIKERELMLGLEQMGRLTVERRVFVARKGA